MNLRFVIYVGRYVVGRIGAYEFWTFCHEGVLGLSLMYGYISPVIDKNRFHYNIYLRAYIVSRLDSSTKSSSFSFGS